MKLDGYRPTDDAAAYDTGIEKTYRFPAPYGPGGGRAKLVAKIKHAGAGNMGYRAALSNLYSDIPEDEDRATAFAGAIYDHCIVEWSTNLQSDGKDLEPSRDNFLMLATAGIPEIDGPMLKLLNDIQDRQTFVEKRRDEAEKN